MFLVYFDGLFSVLNLCKFVDELKVGGYEFCDFKLFKVFGVVLVWMYIGFIVVVVFFFIWLECIFWSLFIFCFMVMVLWGMFGVICIVLVV